VREVEKSSYEKRKRESEYVCIRVQDYIINGTDNCTSNIYSITLISAYP